MIFETKDETNTNFVFFRSPARDEKKKLVSGTIFVTNFLNLDPKMGSKWDPGGDAEPREAMRSQAKRSETRRGEARRGEGEARGVQGKWHGPVL